MLCIYRHIFPIAVSGELAGMNVTIVLRFVQVVKPGSGVPPYFGLCCPLCVISVYGTIK